MRRLNRFPILVILIGIVCFGFMNFGCEDPLETEQEPGIEEPDSCGTGPEQ